MNKYELRLNGAKRSMISKTEGGVMTCTSRNWAVLPVSDLKPSAIRYDGHTQDSPRFADGCKSDRCSKINDHASAVPRKPSIGNNVGTIIPAQNLMGSLS